MLPRGSRVSIEKAEAGDSGLTSVFVLKWFILNICRREMISKGLKLVAMSSKKAKL